MRFPTCFVSTMWIASQRLRATFMHLSEENVAVALGEARERYPAVFHQDLELGMSGRVCMESIDGCSVTLRLDGMFWHERSVVFELCAAYLAARIPEICEVEPASAVNLDDRGKRAPDSNGDRAELARLGFRARDAVVIQHRPGLRFTGYYSL